MEDQHDEQHLKIRIHRKRQPNQHTMQQDPKLEDENARNLRQRALIEHREHAGVLTRRVDDIRLCVSALLHVVARVVRVVAVAVAVNVGGVCAVGSVSVCVGDADGGEFGVAPSEGDEFDEEEDEDGEHGEGEGPRLCVGEYMRIDEERWETYVVLPCAAEALTSKLVDCGVEEMDEGGGDDDARTKVLCEPDQCGTVKITCFYRRWTDSLKHGLRDDIVQPRPLCYDGEECAAHACDEDDENGGNTKTKEAIVAASRAAVCLFVTGIASVIGGSVGACCRVERWIDGGGHCA